MTAYDLGFIIVQVMSEFKLSFDAVLGMDLHRFFWAHEQVKRLEAHRDIRLLRVFAAANSSQEHYEGVLNYLNSVMGVIVEFEAEPIPPKAAVNEQGLDPEFDRAGLRALKARHGA